MLRSPQSDDPAGNEPEPNNDAPTAISRLKRVLRPVFGGVALLFVAFAVRKIHGQWRGGSVAIEWLPLVLSAAPLVLAAIWLAWAWKRLLEHITGQRIPTGAAIALNLESQLARYMPGKVGVPAIRMAGASQLGLSIRTVGSSVFVEVAAFTAVGIIISLLMLLLTGGQAVRLGPWLGASTMGAAGGLGIGTAALVVVDRRHLPAKWLRKLGLEGQGTLVPFSLILSHVGYWICWGAHGFLIETAVGAAPHAALQGAGFFIAAPILGFLALVTPGGIGVREAVLSVGLAPSLGSAGALMAAGLSRAVSLVIDVVVWLGSRPWRGQKPL